MEAGSVGTKLRPKPSTSVSMGDSWWEEKFVMVLFLKIVWSSWRIRRLVFLKFLVVCVSGKSFLNEGMEYGCLGCAAHLYGFCGCMPRKEGGDTWWRTRYLLSA